MVTHREEVNALDDTTFGGSGRGRRTKGTVTTTKTTKGNAA